MPDQAFEFLMRFPEFSLLMDCAKRSSTRFALGGTWVRNLVASSLTSETANRKFQTSFFDFVDPFGSITLVLEDLSKWGALSRAFATMLPSAAFFPVEVTTLAALRDQTELRASTSLDQFLVWFEADEKGFSATLGIINETPGSHLHADKSYDELLQGMIEIREPSLLSPVFPNLFIDRLAVLLTLTYYRRRFPIIKEAPHEELFHVLKEESFSAANLPKPEPASLDSAILDLIFGCPSLEDTVDELEEILNLVPPTWRGAMPFVTGALGIRPALAKFGPALELGFMQEPRRGSSTYYPAFQFRKAVDSSDSLVPWTRLSTGTTATTGTTYCCIDGIDPVVIAWRGAAPAHVRLQRHHMEELGVQAKTSWPGAASGRSDELRLAAPAWPAIDNSVSLRVDQGYLRYALGDGTVLEVGLIPAEKTTAPADAQ